MNWGVTQEGQKLKSNTRGLRVEEQHNNTKTLRAKEEHNAKGSQAKEQPKKVKNWKIMQHEKVKN
jgi:hypothetical protein